MDKESFCWILEAALLAYDNVSLEDMVQYHGIDHKLAIAGIKLSNYLKGVQLTNEQQQ